MLKEAPLLSIKNLCVILDNENGQSKQDSCLTSNTILDGVNLLIGKGEVHAIMGPNGSGKSTLAYTLMGHPNYQPVQPASTIRLNGNSIIDIPADKRAQAGLFLGFQYPFEIEGVPLRDFLRQAYNALYGGTDKQLGLKAFRALLDEKMKLLGISPEFVNRSVNVGCSGGEKKRAEVLQLAVLQPRLAILDEIDSGLDIDALRIVCDGINKVLDDTSNMSLLLITHYQRILKYIQPDVVHVMKRGKITRSGTKDLARELESVGYENV